MEQGTVCFVNFAVKKVPAEVMTTIFQEELWQIWLKNKTKT